MSRLDWLLLALAGAMFAAALALAAAATAV